MKKKETMPLPPLTTKERSVLLFIEDELLSKGVSPSYQEICDHFGFASYNSVQNYLKQLTQKGYVHMPQNQKRAIQILHSAHDFQKNLSERLGAAQSTSASVLSLNAHLKKNNISHLKEEPSKNFFAGQSSHDQQEHSKVLPIPFLGRVAAGSPIERMHENEFIDVPAHFISTPGQYFALKVEGDSMIEEGIFDGDFLVVLSQKAAHDGDLVVASVESESTVKRFFMKKNSNTTSGQKSISEKMVELRPANPRLTSMWYHPQQVEIKGLVKALLRKY